MVTVSRVFEMPTRCCECPMLGFVHGMHETIVYCNLLDSKDYGDVVDDSLPTRDEKCPLEEGKTIIIH